MNQYMVAEKYSSRIAEVEAERAELVDVLRLLYGAQNGPPLLRKKDLEFWDNAMSRAGVLLLKHEKKEATNG